MNVALQSDYLGTQEDFNVCISVQNRTDIFVAYLLIVSFDFRFLFAFIGWQNVN